MTTSRNGQSPRKSAPRKPASRGPTPPKAPQQPSGAPQQPSGAPEALDPAKLGALVQSSPELQQIFIQAMFWRQKYFELKQHTDQVIAMMSQPTGPQQPLIQATPNG